jgi:ribonuclease-3
LVLIAGGNMMNIKSLYQEINKLQNVIGYRFKDQNNLILALTHSSYANENRKENLESNERLEFLGDAVLNIIISEKIFREYSTLTEGEMTKARASIVCEPSLESCSNKIRLGEYLLLGKGEELSGGRKRVSILSDAFEALIGSIYIDGGMDDARDFINKFMGEMIEDSISGMLFRDYKTQLQEYVQRSANHKVIYEVVEEKGPDHNKTFISQVRIKDKIMGVGEGRSKKESEQKAAMAALTEMEKVR